MRQTIKQMEAIAHKLHGEIGTEMLINRLGDRNLRETWLKVISLPESTVSPDEIAKHQAWQAQMKEQLRGKGIVY